MGWKHRAWRHVQVWRHRDDAAVEDALSLEARTVLAVDREVGAYTRSIVAKLALATVIAATSVASVAFAGASAQTPVVWPRLDASTTLAAFAAVGLVVAALQVAARGTRPAQDDPADGARQQILGIVAFATMPVVLWLGFYVSSYNMVRSGPAELDPVRVYGPLFLAFALAVIAADAAAARPFDPRSSAAMKARRERGIRESRSALRRLASRTSAPSRLRRAVETGGALAVIAAQTTALAWVLRLDGLDRWAVLAGFLTVLFLGTCQVVVQSVLSTARGRPSWSALVAAPAILMWLFLALTTLSTALAVSTAENWQQRSAVALALFTLVTGSDVIGATYLIRLAGRRRRLLLHLAVRSEAKRLLLHARMHSTPRHRASTQAVTSLCLSPFFPLGLLLAQPEFSVLRTQPHAPTRLVLKWTIAVSAVSGTACIGALIAIAFGWTPLP